jgi:hypothetical protein
LTLPRSYSLHQCLSRARRSPRGKCLFWGRASTLESSDADVALVERAIGSLRSSRADEATQVEATISDPVARKPVEWIILRSDHIGPEAHASPLLSPPIRAGRASQCSAVAPRRCSGVPKVSFVTRVGDLYRGVGYYK